MAVWKESGRPRPRAREGFGVKGKEKTAALIMALGILASAWLLAEFMAGRLGGESQTETAPREEPLSLAAGTAAELRGMAWSYGGESVALLWDEERGAWVNGEDGACPIDQEKLAPLVEAAAGVKAGMALRNVRDFAQYGLETPILSLTVTAENGEADYEVGNQTLTGEYYLRMDGRDTVYTETGQLLPAFQTTLGELLALETGPEDIAQVTELAVDTDAADYTLSYREGESESWFGGASDWTARMEDGEAIPLETGQAAALCKSVTEISFTGCADWHGEEDADYGLDSPQGTATVTYLTAKGETKTFSLTFGSYDGDSVYVRPGGAEIVYLAEGTVLDRLMYPDWEAMSPRTVCPVDRATVTGAEIRLGGHSYTLERHVAAEEAVDANGDLVTEERVYYVANGWTLESAAADAWLGRIEALEASGPAGEAQGREELLAVVFHRDSETWPEVSFSVWSYDSARCVCTVNEEERYFIPREEGEALVAQGEELLVIE